MQYTNLKAGNYRFQVNVSAPGLGQSWSPQVTAIQIEIQPRLWERPWVLALATIAGLLLLWALVRWRLANLHQRAAQLERIVGQRTSDLQEHADRLRASDQEKTELLERLREQSEAFERMALEDALTGIGNRRSLDSLLDAAFERAVRGDRALCFALFDIDEFKLINDRYSHAVGEDVYKRQPPW